MYRKVEILFKPKPKDCLEDLIGKLCALHPLASEIQKAPEWMFGEWHYWVAEIGSGYKLEDTNWWLYSLSQLMVCG